MRVNWDSIPELLWPFVWHDVELHGRSGEWYNGTCPWDAKPKKFYVNCKTGQWKNHFTGDTGNQITFLGLAAEHYKRQLTPKLLRVLAKNRGLPVEAFKGLSIGWDGEHFTLPVRGPKGTVRDIRRWSPGNPRLISTKGVHTQLYGIERLAKAKRGTTVWVEEGEWDRIAMRYMLRQVGRDKDVTVGLPGATTFKEQWLRYFDGMETIACLDNDEAGDKGATKIRRMFAEAGNRNLKYVNWPEHWSPGWDKRDYVVYALEHNVPLNKSFKKLMSLVGDVHRRDKGDDEFSAVQEQEKITYLSDEEAPTFEELVAAYGKYLEMDAEMVTALKFIVAIVYSQQIGAKEPLWAYLVAAAGGGKTALLASMAGSKRCQFRSTVTPNSLVSGFKSAHDPSLLPKLSGRTFIIKDFTTTLSGPEFDFERVMAILRDAFDGEYQQSYGNDVHRNYRALHFSMVAGVTPAIHAKPMAMMGERFLKLCMRTASSRDRLARIMATMRSLDRDTRMEKDLQDVADRFLSRRLQESSLPEPPREFQVRVAALSQILSALRAQVSRDRYDREALNYRPEPEIGTRPFKQLIKLARSLYFALRKREYDDEIYQLVERVAMDSCIGFNIEIVRRIMERGETTCRELADQLSLSYTTVERALKDLQVLRVVGLSEKPRADDEGTRGRPARHWRIRGAIEHAWAVARVGERHRVGGGMRVKVRRRK